MHETCPPTTRLIPGTRWLLKTPKCNRQGFCHSMRAKAQRVREDEEGNTAIFHAGYPRTGDPQPSPKRIYPIRVTPKTVTRHQTKIEKTRGKRPTHPTHPQETALSQCFHIVKALFFGVGHDRSPNDFVALVAHIGSRLRTEVVAAGLGAQFREEGQAPACGGGVYR